MVASALLLEQHELTQCPRCGFHFDPLTVNRTVQQVLAHPCITALPAATRDFLRLVPRAFLLGAPMGVMQLHRETGYSLGGVHRQLQNLVRLGVAEAQTKRLGGKYCQYRLTILPENREKSAKMLTMECAIL